MRRISAETVARLTRRLALPSRFLPLLLHLDSLVSYPIQPVVVQTRFGFSLEINSQDLIQKYVYWLGHFELRESPLFRRVLRPGDTIVDVGANIGWFTLPGARLVGPRGKVVAFEPSSGVVDLCCIKTSRSTDSIMSRSNRLLLPTGTGKLSSRSEIHAISAPAYSARARDRRKSFQSGGWATSSAALRCGFSRSTWKAGKPALSGVRRTNVIAALARFATSYHVPKIQPPQRRPDRLSPRVLPRRVANQVAAAPTRSVCIFTPF
jgi:hypothetical protein